MATWRMAMSTTKPAGVMPRESATADPVIEARRKRAKRTALLLGGIALLVYVGFIVLTGMGR